jgi:glycolate oxidase FAD binding subunit
VIPVVKQAPTHPALAAIVAPRTYDEVATVLCHANDAGLAVIPLGGRNHVSIGNIPTHYDIALYLTRLDTVVEFEPADLTISCQTGITLGRLRSATAEAGLRVPFDPSLPDSATVGGVLAANISGPARMSLGGPRDFTIGMRVVTADGLITRAGGKVVKNVAGYDLCKLYIGSLASLGVIAEATFKTTPLPIAKETLTFAFADPATAYTAANTAYDRGLSVESAVVSLHNGVWLLTADLAGTSAAIERSAHEMRLICGAPTEPPPPPTDATIVARFTGLPTRLPALLESLTAANPDARLDSYPTLGVCRISTDAADPSDFIATATEFDASLTFERLPSNLKANIDVFSPTPSALSLMRNIKREFDPNGILSPGRMAGRL